ncbi:MAG: phage tail protein [Bacteroidales bacterium]
MEPYVGEIRLFAGTYAPVDWHLCDGTLLQINTNQMLYSLIGTTYGGDGVNTFALPDLRGRVPVGQGQGTGLSNRVIGQAGGASLVQLTSAQMPAHTHAVKVSNKVATTQAMAANSGFAANVVPSAGKIGRYAPPSSNPTPANLDAGTISAAPGGNQAHSNVMPYMALNYIISLLGVYPMRP